ncbi:hypothetical protein PINS_up024493 [Pythium insidiosum]|nr:hypothetical protein PINS_up024493 [Pythium insidiosum]
MADGDAMHSALNEWHSHYHQSDIRWWETVDESVSSCAELQVLVGHHGDDLDRCVRDLTELLDLVELLTRGPMDPRLIHRLVERDANECPMRQRWCSFCDGVDRRVVLTLTPKQTSVAQTRQSFVAVVRRALYERDDATAASPAFPQLRSQLLTRFTKTSTTQLRRSRPIELNIEVDCPLVLEDLKLFLKAVADRGTNNPAFLVSKLLPTGLDRDGMAAIAASQLPTEMKDPFDWSFVVHNEQEDATTSVLATTNLRALHADATREEDPVERLLETLRQRSSELQELRLGAE